MRSRFFMAASLVAFAAVGTASAQSILTLDTITVLATKLRERAIAALAGVSVVNKERVEQTRPTILSEVVKGLPGVWADVNVDDPATAISVRGLQDYGRVAVIIDGARQNFQRSGHNANGAFYVEPETLAEIDVMRGPVANAYGSGAIGGVVQMRTKDTNDILSPEERYGVEATGMLGSNIFNGFGSIFAAGRINENVDVFAGGTWRQNGNYRSGNGTEIANTAFTTWTGLAKATFRPAEGHEIKVGGSNLETDYVAGRPAATQYDTHVINRAVNAGWRYSKPEDRVFDFDVRGYWTETKSDQVKICCSNSAISGALGSLRSFQIDTFGIDANNTTRFDSGNTAFAFTYGVDGFHDTVNVVDPTGTGDLFTPNGRRTVAGGFAQLKVNEAEWLEVIAAGRFDAYRLTGGSLNAGGERFSPKITVALTPAKPITFYGTYAEGYRAPAITETLVAGQHPNAGPGSAFIFLQNPNLRPEVGRTGELGMNFAFDDLIASGDKLRAKANVFVNNVSDYIDMRFLPSNVGGCPVNPDGCIQYTNIANARLSGLELEGNYDAGKWFASFAGHHIDGVNVATGARLASSPPDQVTLGLGVRLFDEKLTVAPRWQHVWAATIPADPLGGPAVPFQAYDLVGLTVSYQPNANTLASLVVDNLLNAQYTPYQQNLAAPGISVKAALKVKLAK